MVGAAFLKPVISYVIEKQPTVMRRMKNMWYSDLQRSVNTTLSRDRKIIDKKLGADTGHRFKIAFGEAITYAGIHQDKSKIARIFNPAAKFVHDFHIHLTNHPYPPTNRPLDLQGRRYL